MSHPHPKVYIDDRLMDSYAVDDTPVAAGMKITYGVGSDLDMQEVESLDLDLIVREAGELDFLELGKVVAVVHAAPAAADRFTYFVGRIQRLSSRPHPQRAGAQLVSLTASDFTADLANEIVYNVNSAAAKASARIGHMGYWAPPGWTLTTFPTRWPDRMHAATVYRQKPYLELFDQFLRGQIMLRANRSTYTPGQGVHKEISAYQDTTQNIRADTLATYTDGSGRWGAIEGTPEATGYVSIRQDASNVLADAGWTKEPDDVITEVSLQRLDALKATDAGTWEDVTATPITSRLHVDTTAARAAFGNRSVEMATDLPAGGPAGDIVPIFEHWLATESMWRAKSLTFKDTDRLTLQQLSWLIAPTSRGRAYLVIRNPMPNRPDPGRSDLRGIVIGGEATWNGKKWELSVTLGRVPGLPDDGNYWSFALLATAAGGRFAAGRFDTIGDELSISDFMRIGAPD